MESLRKKALFLSGLQQNLLDFEDVNSVHCARIMAKLRIWFTEEDYRRTTFFDRAINNSMTLFELLFISSALTYQLLHSSEIPVEVLVVKIPHLLMLCIGLNMIYNGRMYRTEYSEVIHYVNASGLAILTREDKPKFRPLRNQIYLVTFGISTTMAVGAFFAPLPYVLETLTTGKLYFCTVWPLDETPYSVSVYVQCTVQMILIYWMLTKGILFLVVIFEPILRLAISYKILAEDLRSLRKGPGFTEEAEYWRLKNLMEHSNEIKKFVDMANKVNSQFFMRFIFLCFTLTGILLAVFLKSESTWEQILYLSYPCNAYAMAAILCYLGQYLTDSATEMETTIYECDWYSSPLPFKKLVLMFLIRCRKPIIVHAKPFYQLNLALLAHITKSIYVMLTMVRQFFD